MGRLLFVLGLTRPSALSGWVSYVACLTFTITFAGLLANYATIIAMRAFDAELAREKAQSENIPPRVTGSITGLWARNEAVSVDTKPFEHARVAPEFFEKLDAQQIAALKAQISERIVSNNSAPWQVNATAPTYKTMCVRLCDGAYFPISFATTREHFARDEETCQSRCGAPSRLFVFRNPGATPAMMRDMTGRSYVALPTAFQFRHANVDGCSCQAQPWQTASRQRHRLYALEQQRAEGKAVDPTELHALRKQYATAGVASRLPSITASIVASQPPVSAVTLAVPVSTLPQVDARPVELATVDSVVSIVAVPLAPPLPVQPIRAIADATDQIPAGPKSAELKSQRSRSKKRVTRQFEIAEPPQLTGSALMRVVEDQVWGVGRNAYGRPRGDSAYATFSRNFY